MNKLFNKESFWKNIIFFLLIVSIIPVFVTLIFYFCAPKDVWFGYWGSIIGGILGGIFTLGGVIIAFWLDKNNEYIEELPNKVVNIQNIKDIVLNHQFKLIQFDPNRSNQIVEEVENNTNLFFTDINVFLENKKELFYQASRVDTDIFNAVQSYCYTLDIIKKRVKRVNKTEVNNKITEESISNVYNEILEAKEYHKDMLEELGKLLNNKEEFYLDYLYKSGKSEEIIKVFNKHPYLIRIKKDLNKKDS
ncbi:hypothetical protein OCF61_28915 [Bacillus cereus]|nr:hypothetical protein [Bacillus cereus]